MVINIDPQIVDFIKIIVIIFSLFHFLLGVILVTGIRKMNTIIKTPHQVFFAIVTYGYLFLLILILGLVIIF